MKRHVLFLLATCAFIISNAQVGVGTTTPHSTLDVRGSWSAGLRTFTNATAADINDYNLIFTGTSATTITMPTAVGISGRVYSIKNASTTSPTPALSVATTSSQTIDGSTTYLLDDAFESVMLVSDGANWVIASHGLPGGSGSFWTLGGNTLLADQSLGTKSLHNIPFITNDLERMRISSSGNVAIGTTTFNASVPERLLVDGGSSINYVNAVVAKASSRKYVQLNVQNTYASNANGEQVSSDVVATANNGNESIYYIDMGINGQYNTQAWFGGPNDSYVYSVGNTSATQGGNLNIGTAIADKDIVFLAGGGSASNEKMRIDGNSTETYVKMGGSIAYKYTLQTTNTNYTLTSADHVVLYTSSSVSGPTWTLPAASTCPGRVYLLINQGGSALTISPAIITAVSSSSTSIPNAAGTNVYQIISDGTNWRKIN